MSVYYIAGYPISDELYHHGIKGQRWGIRRYQNEDGSLTSAGKARYGSIENFRNAQDYKAAKKQYKRTKSNSDYRKLSKAFDKYDESRMHESVKRGNRMRRMGMGTSNVIAGGVANQIHIGIARQALGTAAGLAISAAIMKHHVNVNDPETAATIMRGTRFVAGTINGLATLATFANIANTARNYTDIKNAQQRRR